MFKRSSLCIAKEYAHSIKNYRLNKGKFTEIIHQKQIID